MDKKESGKLCWRNTARQLGSDYVFELLSAEYVKNQFVNDRVNQRMKLFDIQQWICENLIG